jgi:hypothetical protein
MPQSPQHRPLVQSTRTKYFTRTLAQSTSLEHVRSTSLETHTKYFTSTLAQSTSRGHSHKALH